MHSIDVNIMIHLLVGVQGIIPNLYAETETVMLRLVDVCIP